MRLAVPLAVAPLLSLTACKSKATKQSELAEGDLEAIGKVLKERHAEPLARALPAVAAALTALLDGPSDTGVLPDPFADAAMLKRLSKALTAAIEKSDDLRASKRSYFALCDASGAIAWVDDPSRWPVVGRKLAGGFPSVLEAIRTKQPFLRGLGKYGGTSEKALSFVATSPLTRGGVGVGALIAFWEAHDAAEDLQRQRATTLLQGSVPAKTRVKARDKNQMILDAPELWVLLAREDQVYFEDDVPQPLEDATRALALPQKAKSGSGAWRGTFDVGNASWGGSARLAPELGDGVVIAAVRHDP